MIILSFFHRHKTADIGKDLKRPHDDNDDSAALSFVL